MVSIRAYDPDSDRDINAITAIYGHHVSFGRASFETEPPSLQTMRSRFAAFLEDGYLALVAELDGEIVGYAYAGRHKAREAYLLTVEDSIYVGQPGVPRRSRQIVVTGPVSPLGVDIKWSLILEI